MVPVTKGSRSEPLIRAYRGSKTKSRLASGYELVKNKVPKGLARRFRVGGVNRRDNRPGEDESRRELNLRS
eukprot:6192148-Pleurochrysis_carterae.AAC.1